MTRLDRIRHLLAAKDLASLENIALEELLQPTDDVAFLHYAYGKILGRAPDPGGLEYYRELLIAGRFSRTEVLGALRFSVEGKSLGRAIRRLGWYFTIAKLRKKISPWLLLVLHLPLTLWRRAWKRRA